MAAHATLGHATSPGEIYRKFLAHRNGKLDAQAVGQMMTPMELGFYTTLVLEAAEESLKAGTAVADGVTAGAPVRLAELLTRRLGPQAAKEYGLG